MLDQIEVLKSNPLSRKVSDEPIPQTDTTLDKEKLEKTIQKRLNDSDWKILTLLFENPLLTNREIADAIPLSYEGTSSSLRKMYKLFNLNVKKNHKMNLILKATRISQGLNSSDAVNL